jgi:hypothetical protein
VTPKDFLQVATLGYAKALLRVSRPVLEAALEAGLSGRHGCTTCAYRWKR